MKIPHFGVVEVPTYIVKEKLYLPLPELFTFLKINNSASPGYDSISGFFINEQEKYLVDRRNQRIVFGNKVFELDSGAMIMTETTLYLRSDQFGRVFGLNCDFDFRSLTVVLTTNTDVPLLKEMKQELLRKNLSRMREEFHPDTVIGRKYPFLQLGMADWSVVSNQMINGPSDVWANLSFGGVLAGGEANISLTYFSNQPVLGRNQYYLWRYVNNDLKPFRQIMVGKIATQGISSIFSPVIGVQVTNTPTTFRRSFCDYTLSDYTEPGWTVELYVNNMLVDYTKADASGFFTFKVPLVYGSSDVMLRYYGPWGEERISQKHLTVPFNFLPPRRLEYRVSAGMVEDKYNSIFSRAQFYYGVHRRFTLGAGVEYLSSVVPQSVMPFANFSLLMGSNVLLTAEYTYGVKFKSIFSYTFPWRLSVELNYTRFHENQKAISTSVQEEQKAMFTLPISGKRMTALTRLTIDRIQLPFTRNLLVEWLVSGNIWGINTNLTTTALLNDPSHPIVYSNLSLGFKLPARVLLIPQIQYDFSKTRFVSTKIDIEKKFFKSGVVKLSWEHNYLVNIRNIQLSLRYDFSFAQTSFNAMVGDISTNLVQTARGTIMYDHNTKWVGAGNVVSVGKGGIVIIPFLDQNYNGIRDFNEPKVGGLNMKVTGGRIEECRHDSCLRVFDLEPYATYFIDIDPNSFDNVSWQIRNPTISVTADPNCFKLVEVPIVIIGEIAGMVYKEESGHLVGQGGVWIGIYRNDTTLVHRLLSESDGYYNYMGLEPGNYTVRPDRKQMSKLQFRCKPDSVMITISRSLEGDYIGGVEFVLSGGKKDTLTGSKVLPVVKRVTGAEKVVSEMDKPVLNGTTEDTGKDVKRTDPEALIKDVKVVDNLDNRNTDVRKNNSFTVQVGAYKNQINAINALSGIESATTKSATIIMEGGYFKVRVTGFDTEEEARIFIRVAAQKGYEGSFIVRSEP